MVSQCRRFLTSRFEADLWPALSELLALESSRLQKITSSNPHHYSRSASFRLHIKLLETLTLFASCPELLHGHVLKIADSCVVFLSDAAPKAVQDHAAALFRSLSLIDGDSVWWKLAGRSGNWQHLFRSQLQSSKLVAFTPFSLSPSVAATAKCHVVDSSSSVCTASALLDEIAAQSEARLSSVFEAMSHERA